jgi:hypothetical protein
MAGEQVEARDEQARHGRADSAEAVADGMPGPVAGADPLGDDGEFEISVADQLNFPGRLA